MEIQPRRLTPEELAQVRSWRYDGPYSVYDIPADADFGDPDYAEGYYPIIEDDELVGICAIGAEGSVPGQDQAIDTVDLGFSIAPDKLSQGVGTRAMALAIQALWLWGGARWIRSAIQSWNERAIRLTLSAGFEIVGEFKGADGILYTEVVLELAPDPAMG